jgi:putative membrane-bound dehydrogenase-like protein
LRSRLPLLALLVAATSSGGAAPRPEGSKTQAQPRRIEVLFLGHNSTHHNSAVFEPMLAAAVSGEGINFTYTADPNDLNPAKLARYDALMIYANHNRMTPDQEKALLDFVASGKGFLPIHSASACFTNSEAYIALVGGQFQRHGTGVFTVPVTNPDHPVMQGFQPFEAWDETYVHTKHNTENRTVLMERVDGATREPWTWVRTHGRGRVFYTASGHDERVWSHPMFHRLLRNAILWSVGDQVRAQLEALQIPPLRYSDSPVPVPNYERREPWPKYQEPFDAPDAMKHIQVLPEFELTLFAADPEIVNPIAMAWDERGRLWVIEAIDYPSDKQPDGTGNDVIKILEDTNGDGRADKFTVFADKLSIATSLVFTQGGVMVSQPPDFLFLKDTNGDDRADVREKRISGWSTSDTHAGPSNLHYGFDNWLWGSVGYAGFRGNIGGRAYRFSQGIYRFTPDGQQFEFVTDFTNNTWGLAFNEEFDVFGSTANNEHSVFVAIPERYYSGVPGLRTDGRKKIDGHYAVHPNTPLIRQVDSQGGYTAAAGHNFYTARSFPQEYWNRIAFVNEPTAHVLHRAIIEKNGAGFAEVDGWNILASDDEWFSPVHAEVGPDGALWVADWYHFINQHNPTPNTTIGGGYQFQTGRAGAYTTPLRNTRKGRIYRVAWKEAPAYRPLSLSKDRPQELVAALRHDNMFWRMTAQRLLVERNQPDVLSALYAIVNDRSVDAVGLNSPAVHALWTIHGLGALNGSNPEALQVVQNALTHPATGVRKNALLVLPQQQQSGQDLNSLLRDADPRVRLNALLRVADLPASNQWGRTLYPLSRDTLLLRDEWLAEAMYIAATRHSQGFLAAYAEEIGAAQFADQKSKATQGMVETFTDLSASSVSDAQWPQIQAPALWRDTRLGQFAGVLWLRQNLGVPANAAAKPGTLRLGVISDADQTYINGTRIGATEGGQRGGGGRGGGPPVREYTVPEGILQSGQNVIAVRITNARMGNGGLRPDSAGVFLTGDGFNIPLGRSWRYRVEQSWGSRRPDIVSSIPIALQLLIKQNAPLAAQQPLRPAEGGRPVLEVSIGVVAGQMAFDKTLLTAKPGQAIRLTFNNTAEDAPHNFVLFQFQQNQTLERIIEQMMNDPTTASNNGFVPDSRSVLVATELVDPQKSTTIEFTAPAAPGEYPFVCTFPGHWQTMRGVLRIEP